MLITIVPIKYNSTRVPGKNYRLMNGKPLYWYIFDTLARTKTVSKIICNTDSEEIAEMIRKDFPDVQIYFRPKHLEGGDISTNLLLLDTIETLGLQEHTFLQTHVTNPLLSMHTIEKAIEAYRINLCDSLFSVKQLQTRLYNKDGTAINHDPTQLIPTQDLDPIYEENSCIYLFPYSVLKENNHRIGKNPYIFVMSDIESSDIDYEFDFILTEQLMKLSKNVVKKRVKKKRVKKRSEKKRSEKKRSEKKRSEKKVILVTGSSGGIGVGIVDFFKKKGWRVVGIDLVDISNTDMFFQIDLTKTEDFSLYISKILEKYGRLDCLVNNAALQICKPWDDYTDLDWTNTINCNVKSCYNLSKACRKSLKGGSIVNICSVHCTATSNNIGLYAVSKSAFQGLTKSMSLEYIKDGININCILPGAILTPMLVDGLAERGDTVDNLKIPSQEIGTPKDIAAAIDYLIGAKYCVGTSLTIDGGVSIKLSSE